MKNIKTLIIISTFSLLLTSCSDDTKEQTTKADHVWETQTDALQSAKDTAKKLQESLNQQQDKMDESK